MRQSELAETLRDIIRHNLMVADLSPSDPLHRGYLVPMIHGDVGTGKSQIVSQVCEELLGGSDVVNLAAWDIGDLFGIPYVHDGKMHRSKPSYVREAGERYGLFLDEVDKAVTMQQAILGPLILARCVGDYQLSAYCSVILAGNRRQDRSNSYEMPDFIKNRCVHLNLEPHPRDVADYFQRKYGANVVERFFRYKEKDVYKHPTTTNAEPAFPTFRTWEMWLTAEQSPVFKQASAATRGFVLEGLVGKGSSAEYEAFLKFYTRLPLPADVFRDPTKASVPDLSDAANMSVLSDFMHLLASKATEQNIDTLVIYLKRCPPELGQVCMSEVVQRNPKLKETKAFIGWTAHTK